MIFTLFYFYDGQNLHTTFFSLDTLRDIIGVLSDLHIPFSLRAELPEEGK